MFSMDEFGKKAVFWSGMCFVFFVTVAYLWLRWERTISRLGELEKASLFGNKEQIINLKEPMESIRSSIDEIRSIGSLLEDLEKLEEENGQEGK